MQKWIHRWLDECLHEWTLRPSNRCIDEYIVDSSMYRWILRWLFQSSLANASISGCTDLDDSIDDFMDDLMSLIDESWVVPMRNSPAGDEVDPDNTLDATLVEEVNKWALMRAFATSPSWRPHNSMISCFRLNSYWQTERGSFDGMDSLRIRLNKVRKVEGQGEFCDCDKEKTNLMKFTRVINCFHLTVCDGWGNLFNVISVVVVVVSHSISIDVTQLRLELVAAYLVYTIEGKWYCIEWIQGKNIDILCQVVVCLSICVISPALCLFGN